MFSSAEPEWDYYCRNSGGEFDIERYFNAFQSRWAKCLSCISVADAERRILNKKCLKLHREDLIYNLWRRGRRLPSSQKCLILSLDRLISITLSTYLNALFTGHTSVMWGGLPNRCIWFEERSNGNFLCLNIYVNWFMKLSTSSMLDFPFLLCYLRNRIEFCLNYWSLFSCL